MSTRFYFPSSGTVAIKPNVDPTWDHFYHFDRMPLVTIKSNTAFVTKSTNEPGGHNDAGRNILIRQYISNPLQAQTISGTFRCYAQCAQSTIENIAFSQIVIRAIDSTGVIPKGILYQGDRQENATIVSGTDLWDSFLTTRSLPRSQISPMSLVTTKVSVGDRLVIEVGYRTIHSVDFIKAGSMRFGDIAVFDLVDSQGNTTVDYNPWCQFSQTLSFT